MLQDDGGLMSSTSINVTITDANDQSVQFIYPSCVRPCGKANYTSVTNESYTVSTHLCIETTETVEINLTCEEKNTQ